MRIILTILLINMATFAASGNLETKKSSPSDSKVTTKFLKKKSERNLSSSLMPSILLPYQELTADDGSRFDSFGRSVAIDGDTAVIGVQGSDGIVLNSGSVYVYVKIGGTWIQQQKLEASDPSNSDKFGESVAISGDVIVVGATGVDLNGMFSVGAAYIFTRSGTTWTEEQKLMSQIPQQIESFGKSVAIDGQHGMIGAPGSESAYYFSDGINGWKVRRKLTANSPQLYSKFGESVAIEGDTAVIGAYGYDVNLDLDRVGAVYVFTGSGIIWTQQQKLLANDVTRDAEFGTSVAIDGNNILVGASSYMSSSGAAYVFSNNGSSWNQDAKLIPSDSTSYTYFGNSVAIDGDKFVVGSRLDDDKGQGSGSAYVFENDGSTWAEVNKLLVDDGADYDNFGTSVGISGTDIISGAYGKDVTDPETGLINFNQGAAYFFSLAPPVFDATISGKVLKRNGRGFPKTLVHLTLENGDVLTTRTDPFGNYSFEEILTGQIVVITAYHNGNHQFNTHVINFDDSINDLNIIDQ